VARAVSPAGEGDSIAWYERADGTVEMLPTDHAERVRVLGLRLYDAPDGRGGRRALLDVKSDAGISREYGRTVMFDAIRNLFTTLLEHGSPVEIAVIGSRLPEYINAAKAPLVTDLEPDTTVEPAP